MDAGAVRKGPEAPQETAAAAAPGPAPPQVQAERCKDLFNPGEPMHKLQRLAMHMYGRPYEQLEGEEKMLVGDACMEPLPMDTQPTNTDDVRHAQRDVDSQRLPDMNAP